MTNEVENFLAGILLKAVQTENFDSAKTLIEKHSANPYFVVRESGIAPIHFAVCMENEEAAERFTKYFLKHNGDPNVLTEDCETPLHIACYYGRLKIVQLLMSNGGDISIKDADGNTALNITLNRGQLEVFDLLKKILFEEQIERVGVDDGHMFTPNRINYNFDAASPIYINIRRRRPKTIASRQDAVDSSHFQQQEDLFKLSKSNLKQLEKQNSSISRRSLVNTWKDQVVNTNVEIDFAEILNKFSDGAASSTKLIDENDVDHLMDTFHTANADETKPSETSFIKSPNHLANATDLLQIVEDYRHVDRENGLVFFERKIEPCGSHSSKNNSQSSKASTKFTVPSDYNTAELRRELTQFGDSPGPITKSTKYLYMKRLIKYKRDPTFNARQQTAKTNYSIELEKAIREDSWQETLSAYTEINLETKMIDFFQSSAFNKQKCREGCLKTSFIYLLIDPRISENLPGIAKNLQPLEAWQRFLASIFYVGKGKASRPYSHLYDAIKMYHQKVQQNGTEAQLQLQSERSQCLLNSPSTKLVLETEKLKRITDIWNMGKGVVCLHVFHNTMPSEAYTREAAIIDAIGLNNLTNLKSGSYHGLTNTWTMREKKILGTTLLHKSLHIFLSEGESQLRPTDIKS